MVGGLSLKRRERTRFFFFVAVNLLMNVGLTIGQGVSEGLFLSHPALGPRLLPQLFIATAIATALSTFVYAFYVDKLRNDDYFQIIHAVAVAFLVLILLGVKADVVWCTMAFFGFFYVAQGVFNTHYWNYATDYFDTMEARRLFPYFPLGNSLGGFIGGVLTGLLAQRVPPLVLALAWVLLLGLTFALIRVVSPRLKGWVVTASEEADEASLDCMRQGFVFIWRSRLGRWHLVLAALMITSLFFSQYLYSAIFSRAYPDPQALTAFIGTFLALTNLLELLLEIFFTPRLIGFAGVGAANTFHPTSTLVAIVGMGSLGSLASAVFGRINRETFENAISSSCRNLLYNAYPSRLRGRIRAFLEGVVTNAGTVIAGIVLVLLTRLAPADWVAPCVVGGGITLALGYFWVALKIRREYLNALVHGLKDWRLDLDDATLELEKVEEGELRLFLADLEKAPAEDSDPELLQRIYAALLHRHNVHAVVERLSHPSEHVRAAALHALEAVDDPQVQEGLGHVLRDGSEPLRAQALRMLPRFVAVETLVPYLDDVQPSVAATAAALLDEADASPHLQRAWHVLEELLASDLSEHRVAALGVLPLRGEGPGWPLLLAHVHDPRESVRAAALQRLVRADLSEAPEVARSITRGLEEQPEEFRRAVVQLLSSSRDESILPSLVKRLADESYLVRDLAVTAVRGWGERALQPVLPLLSSPRASTVESAICTLGGIDTPEARERLMDFARAQLRLAHEATAGMGILEAAGAGAGNMAAEGMHDFVRRAIDHIFEVLEQTENPQAIRNIRRCLDISNRQARGDALEALSNIGDRVFTGSLVGLLDDSPPVERIGSSLQMAGIDGTPSWIQVLEGALHHPDRWVRSGTRAACRAEGWDAEGAEDEDPEDPAVMKYLLILKKVPLFAQMSLEQLEAISRIVTETAVFESEVIFKENEMGDRLYVIVEGRVAVVKNYRTSHEVVLATLKETDYFGEMAILDNEPRSATIVVEEDSRLLSISGQKLRDIVQQKPEIAFEIFKVLTQRLRRTDQKLSELVKENSALREVVDVAMAGSREAGAASRE